MNDAPINMAINPFTSIKKKRKISFASNIIFIRFLEYTFVHWESLADV